MPAHVPTSSSRARRTRGGIAASLASAVLLLSGCGGSEPDTLAVSPQAALLGAQAASEQAGSSKLALTIDASVGGQTFSMKGTGAFDYRKRIGSMRLEMPDPRGSGALAFEEVITDSTLYFKSAAFAGVSSKPWLSVDLKGLLGGSLSQLGQADPSQGLSVLQGAEGVTVVGKEKIRGVAATHYKATIDPAKAKARLQKAGNSKIQAYADSLGTEPIPVESWLDSKGRVVRFTMTLTPTSPTGAGQPLGLTMAMDFFDYGKPVSVKVPPADQVGDGSALFGQLGR